MSDSNKYKTLLMELAPISSLKTIQRNENYRMVLSDEYRADIENKTVYYDKKISLKKLFPLLNLILNLRKEKFNKILISTRRIYNTSGILPLEIFSLLSGAEEKEIVDLGGNTDKPTLLHLLFLSIPSFLVLRIFESISTAILESIISIYSIFRQRK